MCGGSFRQAAQPGYGHAWKRDTGLLLSAVLGAGCAPWTQPLWGSPSDATRVPSFPCFPWSSPRRQLINKGWIHPVHLPKAWLRTRRPRPLRGGQGAVRPRCPQRRRCPPSPLPRRRGGWCGCPVCLRRMRPLADPHPGAGARQGSEHRVPRRPPRPLRPGEGRPAPRRGSHFPSPLPLPGTPFSERRGPGRGPAARLGGALSEGGEPCWPWPPFGPAGATTSAPRSRCGPEAGGDEMGDPKRLQPPHPTPTPRPRSLEPRRSGREKGAGCPPRGAVCPCQPAEAGGGQLLSPPRPP